MGRRSAQLVPNLDCDDGEGWLDEHRGSTVGMVACTSARTVAGMSGVGDGDVAFTHIVAAVPTRTAVILESKPMGGYIQNYASGRKVRVR